MKRHIFTSILLSVAALATAQVVTTVSLDDCRRMAVENNAKVRIARANSQAAAETKSEAFTKYFPTVAASGLGFWANKPALSYNFDDLFSLGIIKHGVTGNITAVQPVYAGGRIINGNKLASVGVEASRLEQENAADDVRLTAEQYYWQIVTLMSKKLTLQKVIEMVDTLEGQISVAVKAGVAMPNDLLKVQIKRNDMLALMVDLDNGINLSKQLLAQYIGLDGQPIEIADSTVPEDMPPFPAADFVDPGSALPTTVDYRLLDKQVQAAELEAKMAAGANLPTIGVGAGLFYDDLVNEQYTFGAVFVSVSIPITQWWGGSHAVKRSKIQIENARTQREDLSQMLKLNMTNTWDDLTAAYRKMEIAHESIAQSKENLRLNENYYHAGVTTITELLDAQTLYRQSEDQYTEAYGVFCMARAKYFDATGRSQTNP